MWRVSSEKAIVPSRILSKGFESVAKYKDVLNANKVPKNGNKDREELYEENIKLKIGMNLMEDEIIKLKTKIQFLKKHSKDSFSNPNQENLQVQLRRIIKDLHGKISEKTEENNELRRNLKNTKMSELKEELTAYKEKCFNLTSQLQSITSKFQINSQGTDLAETQHTVWELKKEETDLKKELVEAQNAVINLRREEAEIKKEISNLKELRREANEIRKEVSNLKGLRREANDLRKEISNLKERKREENDVKKEVENFKEQTSANVGVSNGISLKKEIKSSSIEIRKCFKCQEYAEKLDKQKAEFEGIEKKMYESEEKYRIKFEELKKQIAKGDRDRHKVKDLEKKLGKQENDENKIKDLEKKLAQKEIIRLNEEDLKKKLNDQDKILEEKNIQIENLTKQLMLTKISKRAFSLSSFEETPKSDSKVLTDPPKLFKRIFKIIKSKSSFLSLFLASLDKYSTGFIYEDDLIQGTKFQGKSLTTSDISSALIAMRWKSQKIPIKLLEKWYQKFEYRSSDSVSSEKSSLAACTKSTQFEQFLIEPAVIESLVIEPSKIESLKIEPSKIVYKEISFLFEQIKMLMLERNIPRSKFLSSLFSKSLSPDTEISAEGLQDSFASFFVDINSYHTIHNFCIFLLENEENKISEKTGLFSEIAKKLNRYLPEWKPINRYRAYAGVSALLLQNKPALIKKCVNHSHTSNFFTPLEYFKDILNSFGSVPEESLSYLSLISFEKTKNVFGIQIFEVFTGIEEIEKKLEGIRKRHKDFIGQVRVRTRGGLVSLDSFIGHESEVCIPVQQFVGALAAVGVKVTDEFLAEVTEGKNGCDLSLFRVLLTENLSESYDSEFNFQFD